MANMEVANMGKTVAIIDNGTFPKKEYPRYLLGKADIIICCDGALMKYFRNMAAVFGHERMPDVVIGDMDSITPSARRRYTGKIVHMTGQDDNDQTKAVNYVIENMPDVSDIYILGGSGEREDHTIGNISLLMEYARQYGDRPHIEMVSDYTTAFAITGTSDIQCGEGRRISIFSPDNSLTIRSRGLQWPTDGVVFDNWWKATLNRATEDNVHLEFSHPSVALIIMD